MDNKGSDGNEKVEKKEVAKGEKPKNSTVTQARKPVEKDELLSQMQHFFQTNIIFLEDQLKDHLKEMERRLTKAERTSQVLLRTNLAAIRERHATCTDETGTRR